MSALTLEAFAHCRRELTACVVLTILLALISLVPALTVGVILDRVIQTRAFATLLAILLAFALFYVCEIVFTYVHDRLMLYVTHSAVVQAETHFWRVLSGAPYPELERLTEEDGLARFLSIGSDVRFRADWAVAIASVPLCLLIAMAAMFLVSPTLSLPIAILTAAFALAQLGMTRTQRQAARELQRTRERELAAVEQLFRGALSLKAHRAFDFGIERWQSSKNAYESALHRWSTSSVVQGLVSLSFERISLALVLGVGAYEAVSGRLSVGQLVMANMLLRQVSTQVRQVAPLLQRRTAFRESQSQMARFFAGKQRPVEAETVLSVASEAAIVAHKLSFRTGQGGIILEGLSFELPLGQTMAILGESGSGKTTLLKLLSGLYAPSAGIVLVQGQPPATRSDLVYLSQHEHLFGCGILDNVLLGRQTQNTAHEHLRELNLDGILLGQHPNAQTSGQLSGGERQGIFVARALARSDTILFLDEPTTALDADRRAAMVDLLSSAAGRHRAMVFATHDSELAFTADYVLRMANGRLVNFARQQHEAAHFQQHA